MNTPWRPSKGRNPGLCGFLGEMMRGQSQVPQQLALSQEGVYFQCSWEKCLPLISQLVSWPVLNQVHLRKGILDVSINLSLQLFFFTALKKNLNNFLSTFNVSMHRSVMPKEASRGRHSLLKVESKTLVSHENWAQVFCKSGMGS